jgi:adenylate cyclase
MPSTLSHYTSSPSIEVRHIRMRLGISSGEIVTGNMGSTMRLNYTMIGDMVHTAARPEAAAKQG